MQAWRQAEQHNILVQDLLGFKLDDAVNKARVSTATFGSMSRSISVASLQSEQNLLPMASHEVSPLWQDD